MCQTSQRFTVFVFGMYESKYAKCQVPYNAEDTIIGHRRRINKVEVPESLNLNDSEIKHVAMTKSLGAVVDKGLNRDDRFSKVTGKIRPLKD